MNHGRTINLHFKVLLGIIALIGLLILKASFVKAGNDFIAVDLRTDIPFIPNFHDYQVLLASEGGPTGANENNFTTAWLSLNLDDEPGLYGHQFIQVGLIAFNDGLHWFVYAEPGVTCLFGEESYWNDDLNKYLGCLGEVGEFVDFGRFFKVELATYSTEDFWTARVEDEQGTVHNVAFIWSTSKNIYDADVSMEEGYTTVIDPFEYGLFHMWHPQYGIVRKSRHKKCPDQVD